MSPPEGSSWLRASQQAVQAPSLPLGVSWTGPIDTEGYAVYIFHPEAIVHPHLE